MKKNLNPKKILFIATIIILILGLALIVFSNKADSPSASQNSDLKTSRASDSTQAEQITKGTYQNYSEEALANSNRVNLLFFHAPWCPQCRALEKSIQESNIPKNVAIFKVDYDSNQSLRQKYGVTIQTTIVKLNNQAEEEAKFIPYQNPTWEGVQKELL